MSPCRAIVICFILLTWTGWVEAQNVAVQSDSFDSNGVRIAYIVGGKGEPVVLIHGLYSSAEMNWVRPGIFDLLAQHHQVIALDLRGHGKSDKPTDDADYGQPMVEDVVRLMDHLQIQKAHIAGYSLGGIIAMNFVVNHPDRVRSAALGGVAWLRQGSVLQGTWMNLPGHANSGTPTVCVHAIGRLAVTADEVKSIKVPVEVLVGDRDPCKRMYVDPIQSVRTDWPVVVIEGAGHINCVLKDQFKQSLLDWIDKNAGGG